jgi:hypothetical protein
LGMGAAGVIDSMRNRQFRAYQNIFHVGKDFAAMNEPIYEVKSLAWAEILCLMVGIVLLPCILVMRIAGLCWIGLTELFYGCNRQDIRSA